MSLFRSSAWSALSPQLSLPLAPAGALATPLHRPSRDALPRPRAPGQARATTGGVGANRAVPAVLAREPADGR
jgi:hypothetical protein